MAIKTEQRNDNKKQDRTPPYWDRVTPTEFEYKNAEGEVVFEIRVFDDTEVAGVHHIQFRERQTWTKDNEKHEKWKIAVFHADSDALGEFTADVGGFI